VDPFRGLWGLTEQALRGLFSYDARMSFCRLQRNIEVDRRWTSSIHLRSYVFPHPFVFYGFHEQTRTHIARIQNTPLVWSHLPCVTVHTHGEQFILLGKRRGNAWKRESGIHFPRTQDNGAFNSPKLVGWRDNKNMSLRFRPSNKGHSEINPSTVGVI